MIIRRFIVPTAIGAAALIGAMLIAINIGHAADLGGKPVSRAEAEAATTSPWTGFYAGLGIGAVAGVMDPIFGVDGYQYGAVVGYNQQIGRLIVGARVGYDQKHVTAFGSDVSAKEWYYGGIVGFALNNATMAYALAEQPHMTVMGMDTTGLTVGGGLATLLHKDWDLALEYKHETFKDIPNAREHVIGTRLSYHFNSLLGR